MKYYLSLFIFINITFANLWSQNNTLTSEAALSQFERIGDSISASFPQNEIRTFRRESFSEVQLKTYLTRHFQQLDLIPYIKDNHALKIDAYFHSANWFKLIGMPKESINSFKAFFAYYDANEQHLTVAKKKSYLDMRTFGYDMLAANYAKVSYLDSAAIQHKFNIKFAKRFNDISYPSSINNYGLFYYWTKKELDTALIHFNKAYDITQRNFPKHYLIGSIRDNIADIYVEQKKITEANILYHKNFEFYKYTINEYLEYLDITRLISAGSQYISTALALNQIDKANEVFNELEIILNNPIHKTKVQASSLLEVLKVKEALFFKQNKFKDTYQISREVKTLEDSLSSQTAASEQKWLMVVNSIVLDQVKQNFAMETIQKENKIKSQRTKIWFIGLLSSIFIILLVALIVSRRQHLINAKNKQLLVQQKLENSALKVAQLNSKIKSKERDLSDFAIKLTQDQDWAKELADQLEAIKQTSSKERELLINALDLTIANKINVDSDTQDFFERLDKLSDVFYSKLTNSYPNLSKNEIRLCSLIRLKIESRSIATLQNITLASLNTSRYRLRKKLNLSEDVDLDFFIQNL